MAYLIGIGAVALAIGGAWAFLPVERFTASVGASLARFAQTAQIRRNASGVRSAMRG